MRGFINVRQSLVDYCTGSCQLSNVGKHQSTVDHKAAAEADAMRRALLRTEVLLEPTTSGAVEISASDRCLFSTVYYAAKRGIANDTVNSILDIQHFNGVDCKYVNLHSSTILDVEESIVTVLYCQMKGGRVSECVVS